MMLPPVLHAWRQNSLRSLLTPTLVIAVLSTHHVSLPGAPLDPIEDRPGLPRVLLLGDSISIAYTLGVRDELRDEANVHRAPVNCGPTLRALESLEHWLGPARWDLIHFNFGLHDLKFIPHESDLRHNAPKAPVADGQLMVPLPEYEANLREIVRRLSRSGARLIWSSTTPIPQGAEGRVPGHEIRYNAAAAAIMDAAGVPIHDLHTYAAARLDSIQRPADVHFTNEGSTLLAKQVAAAIRNALPARSIAARPLESLTPQSELPDPLTFLDGRSVRWPEQWPERRSEILDLLAHYVYGHMPPPPATPAWSVDRTTPGVLDGKATRKLVSISFGGRDTPPIQLLVYSPNQRRPAPVFLGLNFEGNHTVAPDRDIPLTPHWVRDGERATEAQRGVQAGRWPIEAILARGYAVATFYQGDIDPDHPDWSDGVHPLYYRPGQTEPASAEWGTIAAWAWGLHRCVDYLVQDPDLDPQRIAVMGHSRNGKTALVAAAWDERIALTVSNQSGCGGAALSRRRSGETVKAINDRFPHWFCQNFKFFNDREDHLPLDQHFLIAAIAPRPVLVCSAEEDAWADPAGEFASLRGANPVYRLLQAGGIDDEDPPPLNALAGDTLGYHIRPGEHAVGLADWTVFLDFADRQWFGPR
ncbi:MAG TPA: GDSL-type esterase/lipase family protein [Verrucomicrobiales bacterium]|nr:GDSL-type esterase/lipase family protein [Verrucomicrobiales bacterium]